MNYCCIYKIENQITHDVYIGKTLFGIKRRWKQHIRNLDDINKNYLPLYVAMNEYGVENFTISEVEAVGDYKQLADREMYWIEYYDSYNHGYNDTVGGDGFIQYDYDYIWELWQNGLNIKDIASEVHCNDQVVRTVLNIHNVSTKDRKERSAGQIKCSHDPYKRRVYKKDAETGEVIQEYESVRIAAAENNIDNSYLSKVCRASATSKGFRWEYVDNDYVVKKFDSRPVEQYDLVTNEIICTYSSINQAAKAVGGDSSYISKVCRGEQKSSKGFGWRFAVA